MVPLVSSGCLRQKVSLVSGSGIALVLASEQGVFWKRGLFRNIESQEIQRFQRCEGLGRVSRFWKKQRESSHFSCWFKKKSKTCGFGQSTPLDERAEPSPSQLRWYGWSGYGGQGRACPGGLWALTVDIAEVQRMRQR